MADSQVKTANICNITIRTRLNPNAGGSGTYIADNSISVHMTGSSPASGIYIDSLPEQSVIGDKYTISFIPICATNTTLLIELAGAQKSITFTSGVRKSVTIQASAANRNAAFYGGNAVEKTIIIKDIQIEKGETATVYRPYSATGWQHSLRKLTTATDTFTTLPVDIYADGNNATVGLKGNTVQSGTPTPDNPIMPQGTGERTENLWSNDNATLSEWISSNGEKTIGASASYGSTFSIPYSGATSYTIKYHGVRPYSYSLVFYDSNGDFIIREHIANPNATIGDTIIVPNGTASVIAQVATNVGTTLTREMLDSYAIMLNSGLEALSYEPYGQYKIPISSANTTTSVYMGEVETTRRIKKYICTGDETVDKIDNNIYYLSGALINSAPILGASAICTHYENNPVTSGISANLLNGQFTINQVGSGNYSITIHDNINGGNVSAQYKQYLAQQYAAGTPVTVWYVLASETTGIVNEPLMKIGDYADEVLGITVPTITGKDTFDVETTLKPSDVTLSYTGWHDATVEEWDGSEWT